MNIFFRIKIGGWILNVIFKGIAKKLPIVIIMAIISSQVVAVPTDSMTPVINAGDMVLVQKTDLLGVFNELNPDDVKVGDIIIYSKPMEAEGENHSKSNESIIHRVVAIKTLDGNKYFILKGDNNLDVDDERVYPSQISGRAIVWGENPVVIPQLGNIIIFLKTIIEEFITSIHGGG